MPKSKKIRPSSTPGILKGENCHRSQIKNRYAKDSRWHKTDPEGYAEACVLVNSLNWNRQTVKKEA